MPIYLDSTGHKRMIRAAEQGLPNETGGLLLGYRADDYVCVEDVVVVPGPSGPRHFVMRQEPREKALLNWLAQQPEDSVNGYVGTWHVHPGPSGFSTRDLITFGCRAVCASSSTAMIVAARTESDWRLFGRAGSRLTQRSTTVVVI